MTDPQHVLLAQDLISRIQSGEFAVGDKLPTELELCQTRSLARGTVRQALKHLEDAGMISRRRGAGTTVESPEPVVGHQAFVTSSLGMLAFVERTRITDPSSESLSRKATWRNVSVFRSVPSGIGCQGHAWFGGR